MFATKSFRKLISLRFAKATLPSIQRGMAASAAEPPMEYRQDPQPLFTDPETQRLLESMTQVHLSKLFRKRSIKENTVEYKFMTTEELEDSFRNALSKARHRLQMPPVVMVNEDAQRTISMDPALAQFSDTKYVITDITYGLRQSARKVVVRETDGTLKYAPLDVAKRMKQIYFPLNGRKLQPPKMFESEHLERCLDEHKYEFILDRLAVQYEPNELDYHRISARVYQHLNESKQFDMLRSTRHFGPMAFFYAWHKCIDNLLYDMIQRDYLRNGVELIALMYKIHGVDVKYADLVQKLDEMYSSHDPALEELRKSIKSRPAGIQEEIKAAIGKTSEDFEADEQCFRFIEQYISTHALKKIQLELAVQTLKEITAEKRQLYEGLSKAHGVQ